MSLLYSMYQQSFLTVVGLVIVAVWTLVWKGLALWHTGKNQQRNWFIAILILNTAGLLPIIYLLWFKPEDGHETKDKTKKVKKEEKSEIIEISEKDLKEELNPKEKTTKKKSPKKSKSSPKEKK